MSDPPIHAVPSPSHHSRARIAEEIGSCQLRQAHASTPPAPLHESAQPFSALSLSRNQDKGFSISTAKCRRIRRPRRTKRSSHVNSTLALCASAAATWAESAALNPIFISDAARLKIEADNSIKPSAAGNNARTSRRRSRSDIAAISTSTTSDETCSQTPISKRLNIIAIASLYR